ncbi:MULTISPECIES: ABC transporter substrate-binding protein [Cohnella]|jgi:multiple sugar transport system substrate-binding protein|uniref:ABC transporter substrate-binding protein n=1 Tax=Cohnella TaxID=329857 RepID=UPI000E38ED54|nr:extracellular solute-binding protein [Cohnella sp.]REK60577.1 MAG: sugar ABC transporter substrate-binding protein [Cohnella sp.]
MKKALTMLLMVSLVIGLAACGGGNSGGNGAAGPSPSGSASSASPSGSADSGGDKEPVTLRIAWWGGQARHDYTLKVIELYESLNPHVTIEPEYASFDDHWKKLAPQAAAKNLPDIIQMDISYLSQYGTQGQIADLTPFIENGTIDTSNISESAISGGKIGDKLYAFNLGSNALLAVIDKAMLEKAGGKMPSQDWTWDDVTAMGETMKSQGKLLTQDLRHDVFFPFYLRSKGQHMYAADGKSLGYDDDKYFIDFYTMYNNWYQKGYLLSLDKLAQKKGTPEDGELELGNAVSTWGWSNQYILSSQVAKRPFEILPVPGWNENKALFLKPSMYFSIAENSKHKEEAAKFIDFWVNNIDANKIIMGERGVPVSSAVKEALKPLLSPEQAKVFDYVSWAEQNSSEMDPPNPPGATEVDKLLKETAEQIMYKKLTVEEAAKKFREEANKILAKK